MLHPLGLDDSLRSFWHWLSNVPMSIFCVQKVSSFLMRCGNDNVLQDSSENITLLHCSFVQCWDFFTELSLLAYMVLLSSSLEGLCSCFLSLCWIMSRDTLLILLSSAAVSVGCFITSCHWRLPVTFEVFLGLPGMDLCGSMTCEGRFAYQQQHI